MTAALAAIRTRPAAGDGRRTWSWGLLPLLALSAALGLTAVAAANRAAAEGAWWAELAFYGGLLLIVLPIGLRLVLPGAEGTERVSLVAVLGVALFLCKIVHDPLRVGGYDEFLHWRTAQDMVTTGTIFTPNTLLGVSPYYPGLELVTTALSSISGMPIFESGIVVLLAARIIFVVSLFFFFAMLSGSTRVAGIAALVYMANPKFLYFNSQFAYESLALPLGALLLYLLARRANSAPSRWLGLAVIAVLTVPAIVVTHHVTSGMFVGFLAVWAIVAALIKRRDRAHPGRFAGLMLVLIVGWTLLVATSTIGYLAPALTSTVSEILRLALGEVQPRQLFVSSTGDAAPLWERLTGSASAALILGLLPFGLLVVWRRYRNNAAVLALGLAALAYPATLLARLTPIGADVAGRTPEFLFIGIGLVVGLALVRLSFRGALGGLRLVGVLAVLGVLFIGGTLVGIPGWGRLPGPYLVSADGRSVETQGIAAAEWARETLGPGNKMIADRVNRILMSSYGLQEMVTAYETRVPVRNLYLADEMGPVQRNIVRQAQIRYLVVDRRLTTAKPVVGHFFDSGEEDVPGGAPPIDPAFLEKFDRQPDISRIFDSGDIQIYDVSGVATRR